MLRALMLIPLLYALLVLGCSSTRQAVPDVAEAEDVQTPPTPQDVPTPPSDGDDPPQDESTPPSDPGPGDGADPADGEDVGQPAGPTVRPCTQRFEYDALDGSAQTVHLAGEFNDWSTTSHPLVKGGGSVWSIDLPTLDLEPGSMAYKFVVDGSDWVFDPANPMRKHVGVDDNSKAIIADCKVPLLELVSASQEQVSVRLYTGGGSDASVEWTVAEGFGAPQPLPLDQVVAIDLSGKPAGKHTLHFSASNGLGDAEPLFVPVWIEDEAFDWSDAVLYFAMTDRFHDGDPATGGPDGCLPPDNKANWLGGDWAGVRQKIEAGYFDALGVNAIWLTAFVDNPQGCMTGGLAKQYTSYHGYFPASQLAPESQLGSMADLQAMVAAAHERGIRVVVDLVANHLHTSHPFVSEHPGWFNDELDCKIDGNFDNNALTCWFEPYTPDLNYEQDDAVEEMTEAALWWIRNSDVDGFRIDAVKHMHDNFLRTLRYKVDRQVQTVPDSLFWMVGETFTGDWGGGSGDNEGTIKKYIAPHMLHGQFDFPLYWRILRVFARDEEQPLHLADLLSQGDGFYGSQAIMSNFLGNHDVPRFVSHAAGQIGDLWGNGAKEQGWDQPPGQPSEAEPYERLKLAFSFLFTIRGVPLIYYGDEIGLAGAGDPDNRREMVFDGWTPVQQSVYDHIGALAAARKAHPSLRNGSYKTLLADGALLVFERSGGGETAIVALNRSGVAQTAMLAGVSGSWTDALSGEVVSGGSSLSVVVQGWSVRILSQ